MSVAVDRFRRALHPFNAVLLGGVISLFLAALLSDIAYFRTYEIQWNNFSSWLLVGGLVVTAIAFFCAIGEWFRLRWRVWPGLIHALLVVATWVLGFVDVLEHAKDAWATMPGGLVLSGITVAVACVALWIAFAGMGAGEAT
ncbi:MAG TPA: DUF2231 domain-containing protein [Rhodanobacteraceae bacterium]|nr:DUF2231 domain-containing protein [Rhodanobacteraceae bacterium]